MSSTTGEQHLVNLDIRGKKFQVPKYILERSEYFLNIFNDVNKSSQEAIYLSRSPKIFKHILEVLYDETYPFPAKYQYEFDFYLIDKKNANIYTPEYKNNKDIIENVRKELNLHQQSTVKHNNDILNNIKSVNTNLTTNLGFCSECFTMRIGTACVYDEVRKKYHCSRHRECNSDGCSLLVQFGKLYCKKHDPSNKSQKITFNLY
jgi:hypothetical protein